jgi:hypothetical protein
MYTVRWKRAALNRLTELWLDAADRSTVTMAVDEIDRLLAADPHAAGESRFVPALGVFFDVHQSSQFVEVLKVWTF